MQFKNKSKYKIHKKIDYQYIMNLLKMYIINTCRSIILFVYTNDKKVMQYLCRISLYCQLIFNKIDANFLVAKKI
jgi:hypothetical protein